jgi:hypothetical protein
MVKIGTGHLIISNKCAIRVKPNAPIISKKCGRVKIIFLKPFSPGVFGAGRISLFSRHYKKNLLSAGM